MLHKIPEAQKQIKFPLLQPFGDIIGHCCSATKGDLELQISLALWIIDCMN